MVFVFAFRPARVAGGRAPVEGEIVGQIVRIQFRILLVSGIERNQSGAQFVDRRRDGDVPFDGRSHFLELGFVAVVVADFQPIGILSGNQAVDSQTRRRIVGVDIIGIPRLRDPVVILRTFVFEGVTIDLVRIVRRRPVEGEVVAEIVGGAGIGIHRDPVQAQLVNFRRVRIRTDHLYLLLGGRFVAVGVDRGQTVGAGAVDVFAIVENPGRELRRTVVLRHVVRNPGSRRRPLFRVGGLVCKNILPDMVFVFAFRPARVAGGRAPVEGEIVGQIVRIQFRILLVSGIERNQTARIKFVDRRRVGDVPSDGGGNLHEKQAVVPVDIAGFQSIGIAARIGQIINGKTPDGISLFDIR